MPTSIKNDELLYDIYDLRNELKQNFSDLIINFNIIRTDEKSRLYNDEDEKDEDEFKIFAYITFIIFIPIDEKKYRYKLTFAHNGFSGIRHSNDNKDISKFLLDFLITSKVFKYVKPNRDYSNISKIYDINFKKLYSENIINEYKLYTLENSI